MPDSVVATIPDDRLFTIPEVAGLLKVPKSVVYSACGVVAPFPPHVMFYAPYLTNADLGSEGQAGGGPAFVAAAGTPYALIIVPVGGTPNGPSHQHPGDSR